MTTEEMNLINKRTEMNKRSWIKNVMRIHPEKTIEETEALYEKLFGIDLGPVSSGTPCTFNVEEPDKVIPL